MAWPAITEKVTQANKAFFEALFANVETLMHTAETNATTPGAWLTPTLNSTKLENAGGSFAPGQLRQVGKRAFARGVLKVKTGQTLAAGETILTVPSELKPPEPYAVTFWIPGSTMIQVEVVAASGIVKLLTPATLAAAATITLEPFSYSLT